MWKILEFIQKNLIWTIPISMLFGFIYGYFSDTEFLKSLIVPMTFLMVYPMMVTVQFKSVLSAGDFKLQGAALFINFIVLPVIGFGAGRIFFADNPAASLGLLLTSLLPTSGMTISWTGFAKGNLSSAVKMTVIGLIVGSVATPFYTKWLMGAEINFSMIMVFRQIGLVVFLPLFLGFLTQLVIVKKYGEESFNKKIKPKFPLVSTLGVLSIVFIAIALKAKGLASDPQILLKMFFPLIFIYIINLVISSIAGKLFFNRADSLALVFGTVLRNLSIALAIAMTSFGEIGSSIALIIAMAYIIQVQVAAWYVRFADRIFGPALK